jgi:hypothetical protein
MMNKGKVFMNDMGTGLMNTTFNTPRSVIESSKQQFNPAANGSRKPKEAIEADLLGIRSAKGSR